mmetsp:Transcript_21360/g.20510  ORF Transcript_21360/g.20510 Transcript_21360/m.20510 type:complete len:122 (-) Transcript_21360:25-390(-)
MLFAFSLGYQWSLFLTTLFGLGTLGLLVKLCMIPSEVPGPHLYSSPFFPVLPALGLLCNFILSTGLDTFTWVLFILYQLLGLAIYVTYGYRHSVINQRFERNIKSFHEKATLKGLQEKYST